MSPVEDKPRNKHKSGQKTKRTIWTYLIVCSQWIIMSFKLRFYCSIGSHYCTDQTDNYDMQISNYLKVSNKLN